MFLQDLIWVLSPFSRETVSRTHRQHFFLSNWVLLRSRPHDRIAKWNRSDRGSYSHLTLFDCKHADDDFLNWAPGEPGKGGKYIMEKSSIQRREWAISHIFGEKARTNVLKGPLSTDCKSDCLRIGLKSSIPHPEIRFWNILTLAVPRESPTNILHEDKI